MEPPNSSDTKELTRAIWSLTEVVRTSIKVTEELVSGMADLHQETRSLQVGMRDLECSVDSAKTEMGGSHRPLSDIENELKIIRTDVGSLYGIKLLLEDIQRQNEKMCRVREAEELIGSMGE